MASGMPNRLAVLGSPIGHSRSPLLHRAAYRALGLDWSYEAVEVQAGALAMFLGEITSEWRGVSLTMPLKHEILPWINDCDDVAERTGSVNTVLFHTLNGRRTLCGYNTDVAGLVRALAEAGVTQASHVTLLGAGATAASALVAAAEMGAGRVTLLVRNAAKTPALCELGRSLGVIMEVQEFSDITDTTALTSELVISTMPGGTVLDTELPRHLRERAVLFDVAYSPWPSAVALSFQAVGGSVVNGIGMLLHQALIQVRIFVSGDPTHPVPDESVVLAAMRGALTRDPVER